MIHFVLTGIFAIDCFTGSLTIRRMSRKHWTQNWGQMSDTDLESAARYYFWLATNFPELHKDRLDEIILEARRRGKPEILEQAKASIHKAQAGG